MASQPRLVESICGSPYLCYEKVAVENFIEEILYQVWNSLNSYFCVLRLAWNSPGSFLDTVSLHSDR